VIGEPFFKNTAKGEVTVYPARINCNLKSQTIEEIKGHRQKEILAMLPYLKGALQRDMSVFVEALAADFKEKAEGTQLKKLDALQAQISRDFDAFDALSSDLATPEKMILLNQDSNYKQSICKVIDFKHVRMSKLVRELSALDQGYLQDPLTTGLHMAAKEGRTKTVAALLSFGADTDAKDNISWTALHYAAAYGHHAMAQALLRAGADVNAKDRGSNTALHLAANKGHCALAQALLGAGADVNAKNSGSQTANGKDRGSETALHLAADKGNHLVAQALLRAGADVNAKDSGSETALHKAARHGHDTVAQALLGAGADVKSQNRDGRTSLDLARAFVKANKDGETRRHQGEVVEELLRQHCAESTSSTSSFCVCS